MFENQDQPSQITPQDTSTPIPSATPIDYSPMGQQSYADTKYDLLNSKIDTLQQAKKDKAERLGPKIDNNANLDPTSFTKMPDGTLESNSNKIWNDLSDTDYQAMIGQVIGKYGVPKEKWQTMTPQERSKYEWLYMGHGKDDPNLFKIGLAAGDMPGAEYRYEPGRAYKEGYTNNPKYGWASGPGGIDDSNMDAQILLPTDIATTLEALTHGRQKALENRAAQAGNKYAREQLGDGYTEYYASREGALGDTSNANLKGIDLNDLKNKWDAFEQNAAVKNPNSNMSKEIFQQLAQQDIQRQRAESSGPLDRLYNTGAAVSSSLTKEVVLDTADWLGETAKRLTGHGWDVGTYEQKAQMAAKLFNYNPYFFQQAGKVAGEYAKNIYEGAMDPNKSVQASDVWGLVKTGLENPEMLGESLGYIAGLVLGTGKFTAAGKVMSAANSARKAGEMTPAAADAAIKAAKDAETASQFITRMGASNVGFATIVAGNVNDEIDTYKQNNNGESPSASHVVGMLAVESAMNAIDRFADIGILKGGNYFGDLKRVASIIPEEKAPQLAAKVIVGAAKLASSAGVEASQEYIQQMGLAFNEQFGSSKYGSDVMNILTDKQNVIDALAAAGMGAAMGVEMHGAHYVSPVVKQTADIITRATSKMVTAVQAMTASSESTQNRQDVVEASNQVTKDTRANDALVNASKQMYGSITNGLASSFVASIKGISPSEVVPEDVNTFMSDPENRQKVVKQISDIVLRKAQQTEGNELDVNLQALVRGMNHSGDAEAATQLMDKIATVKGIAPEKLQSMLGSSADFLDTLSTLANKNAISDSTIENIKDMSSRVYGDSINPDIVEKILNSGKSELDYVNSIQKKTGKSIEDVSSDVLVGPIGLFSYYRRALTAQALGDANTEQQTMAHMKRLIKLHTRKLDDLREGLSKVEEYVSARKALNKPVSGNTHVVYFDQNAVNATGGFTIHHSNVASTMGTEKLSSVERVIEQVKKELSIGKDLLDSLVTGVNKEPNITSKQEFQAKYDTPEEVAYEEYLRDYKHYDEPPISDNSSNTDNNYDNVQREGIQKVYKTREILIESLNDNTDEATTIYHEKTQQVLSNIESSDMLDVNQKNFLKSLVQSGNIALLKNMITHNIITSWYSNPENNKNLPVMGKLIDTLKEHIKDC